MILVRNDRTPLVPQHLDCRRCCRTHPLPTVSGSRRYAGLPARSPTHICTSGGACLPLEFPVAQRRSKTAADLISETVFDPSDPEESVGHFIQVLKNSVF